MALDKSMKQKLSGNKASLEINLDELFDVIVPDNSEFRQAVGQAIIDKIRSKAQKDNEGIDGKFEEYSKEYKESEDFLIYGKSPKDVNLTASGEMLGLMDIIEEGKNKIVIGWEDDLQAKKAHGHVTGSVGKERNFLGLTEDDVDEIRDQFIDDLPPGDDRESSIVDEILAEITRASPVGIASIDTVIARNFDLGDDDGF